MSPLCWVVRLRYARSASSMRSSETQGLETIAWSSIVELIGHDRMGSSTSPRKQGRISQHKSKHCGSSTLPLTHHSRTARAPRPPAPFPTELDLRLWEWGVGALIPFFVWEGKVEDWNVVEAGGLVPAAGHTTEYAVLVALLHLGR